MTEKQIKKFAELSAKLGSYEFEFDSDDFWCNYPSLYEIEKDRIIRLAKKIQDNAYKKLEKIYFQIEEERKGK